MSGGLDVGRLDALVDAVAARVATGTQVVLVSSGAIAAGLAPLGLARRPRDLATQQAAASVGQLHLTSAYADAFARHERVVGQVLLTSHDVVRRAPYRNAQRTFERLLGLGVCRWSTRTTPTATDEIRFGDNDRLAALVAHIVGADALVLLSDVDGVYDDDPSGPGRRDARRGPRVADLEQVRVGTGPARGVGTGGMASKLAAARPRRGRRGAGPRRGRVGGAGRAGRRGRDRLRADRPAALGAPLLAEPHGRSRGRLHLDDGAVRAITSGPATKRRSLLAAGITGSDGDFEAGDVVELVGPHGETVARGVVAFDAEEMPELVGRKTRDLAPEHRREVVHADDLVPVRGAVVGGGAGVAARSGPRAQLHGLINSTRGWFRAGSCLRCP